MDVSDRKMDVFLREFGQPDISDRETDVSEEISDKDRCLTDF